MADFSTTNLGESPSGPSVRSPVTTLDSAVVQGISDVAGGLSDLTAGFQSRKASSLAAAKYQKTISDEERVGSTIQQVDNGLTAILQTAVAENAPSSVVEARLNKFRVDALNNPNFDKATVVESFKTFRTGRGKASLEKTQSELFEEEVKKVAAKEGISEYAARASLRSQNATARLLKHRQNVAGLAEIDRKNQEYTLDYTQADYIQSAAGAFTAGIAEDIRQNGAVLSNLPPEEAAARIRELRQGAIELEKTLRNSIEEGDGFSSTEKAMQVQLALVEKQVGIYEDFINGTTTGEVANQRLENAISRDQLFARKVIDKGPNSERNRAIIGMAGVYGRSGIAVENLAMDSLEHLMDYVQEGKADSILKPNSLTTLVKEAETNTSYTPEEKKSVAQTLVDMSGDLALYHDFPQHDTEEAGATRQSILRAYAAPSVGKFLEANDVQLPPSVKRRHKAMQSAHLNDVLIPSIERDFVRGVTIQKPGGGVEVKKGMNHAKMEVGSDGLVEFVPLDAESDPVVVRSLNNKVALLLNEWIRGTTHMIGSTDYTLWSQNPADVQALNDLFKAAAE